MHTVFFITCVYLIIKIICNKIHIYIRSTSGYRYSTMNYEDQHIGMLIPKYIKRSHWTSLNVFITRQDRPRWINWRECKQVCRVRSLFASRSRTRRQSIGPAKPRMAHLDPTVVRRSCTPLHRAPFARRSRIPSIPDTIPATILIHLPH